MPAKPPTQPPENQVRDHWTVPVQGISSADTDGAVHVVACRDGTVLLRITYRSNVSYQRIVKLDVSRAAQLSTAVWEAAGVAQQLAGRPHGGPDSRAPGRDAAADRPST